MDLAMHIFGVFGVAFAALGVRSMFMPKNMGEARGCLRLEFLMGAVVIGRLVRIVADGFDKVVPPNLVTEIVIGGGLVTAHFVLG